MATAAAAPCRPPLSLNLASSSSSSPSSPSSKPPSTLLNFPLKIPNPNLTLKKTLPLKFPRFSISAAAGGGNQKKEQKLTSEGLVTEALPNCMFRVKLENGDEILGYLSGKMQKNKIFIVPGDRVEIEVGKYDATRGRITFRRDSRARRPSGGGKDQKSSR